MIGALQSDYAGLLIQFVLSLLLLWLFAPPSEKNRAGRILFTAILLVLINLGIEWTLRDLLREGTLVVEWMFFSLLASRLALIPLPRSMLMMFCLFSLLLGWGLYTRNLSESPPLQEHPDGPNLQEELLSGLLHARMLDLQGFARNILYAETKPEPPLSPTPTATPAPEPTPRPRPPADMSGSEFEALFYPTEAPNRSRPKPPPSSSETRQPIPTPRRELPRRELRGENEMEVQNTTSVSSEHMSEMVQIRNRSTDPRYAPPDFSINALGIGAKGKYALVEGEFIAVGGIIRTGEENPRGWKLTAIEPNELYWQPLK